jgi:diaminopimelate epimerase
MGGLPFTKMHGLGNDFVVLDARARALAVGPAAARAIADRRTGVGCDQLLVVERAMNGSADAFMRIFNADGGESGACGNGARCVAGLLMTETGKREARIETLAGVLAARAASGGMVEVDMGPAKFGWRDVPLAREADTLNLDYARGPLTDPVALNVGNPHVVFFVDDAAAVPLAELGPKIEFDPLFPERTNVDVAEIVGPGEIRLRVWERGAGITRACGSGACAALVAASRRGLARRRATVALDGGPLVIEWRPDGNVVMTGPVATSFTGVLDDALLAGARP